jgi:carbon-monoxide dehydrogenase large subunit
VSETITIDRPRKYVGSRMQRVEDPAFLRGQARFVDDIKLPQMAHLAFARSPYAHANITSVDVSEAAALDGVIGVFTGEDLAKITQPIVSEVPAMPSIAKIQRRCLPVDKVRHVGEAFAVVVAESRYIAEDAVDLIVAEWEPLEPIMDPEAALKPGSPRVHEEIEDNNIAHMQKVHGDVDKVFASADHVFSVRFHGGRYMAAPLETRGTVVEYDKHTGDTVMWTSTQTPHFTRTLIAPVVGIPESKLRIIAPAVGGGFGLKCSVYIEDVVLLALARRIGRPLKWIEDRYEHLAASQHSKEIICYVDLAVQNDGTFLGFRGHFVTDAGAYSISPWTALIDALPPGPMLPSVYDVQHVQWTLDAPMTNKCMTGPYRGIGLTPGHNARELLIDEAARGLGIDPAELRLKNCIPAGPYRSVAGPYFDSGSYPECIEASMEMIDYSARREQQKELREQGRYIGIGISPFMEPTAYGSEIGKATGMEWQEASFDVARIIVEPDGSVSLTTGQCSHGQGHATTFAQVAADALGVKVEDVVLRDGDTGRAPYGMGTWASRSGVIGAGSIMRAGREVREKLIKVAAHAMEVGIDDIELEHGVAAVKGVPGKSMTVAEIAGLAYFGGSFRPADLTEPYLSAARSYDPPQAYTNGCVAAVVEVDVETGAIEIQKMAIAEDCGQMLNPMVVDGQILGACAQGVGGAFLEHLPYDENGQLLAGSLMDYLLPATMEVPDTEIRHFESPGSTEGGVKGTGEGGMVALPAALLAAVADALAPFGAKVTKSPIGPNDIRNLVREASGRNS